MAGQEALGDGLSDQGHHGEARGEAFVTHSFAFTRRAAFALAASFAFALASPAPSFASAKIQHLISPGGIEAWFVQDATVPLIAMEYAFGRGAIELSFSVTRDNFRGSLRMLKDNKDEAFDLLQLALTSPHLDATDVERIRTQIMSGLHRDTTSPNALASRKFLEVAFPNHPYSRPGTGTLESVPTITVADMRDYIRRVIAKDTLKISVVGDIDPATLGKLIDQTFGGLPAK